MDGKWLTRASAVGGLSLSVMLDRSSAVRFLRGVSTLLCQCIVLVKVEWGSGSNHRQARVMSHT